VQKNLGTKTPRRSAVESRGFPEELPEKEWKGRRKKDLRKGSCGRQ